jgi:hypothetical protein
MGWTTTYREKGIKTEDFFCKEFGDGRNGGKGIIKLMTHGTECYAAYRMEDDRIIGLVILTSNKKDSYFNFGWKEMTEDMGPCYYNCPKAILDMLTPLPDNQSEYDYSHKWRKLCYEQLAKNNQKLHIMIGTTIKFQTPLTFRNGIMLDTFTCVDTRKHIFSANTGGLYRLPPRCLTDYAVI